MRKSLFALAAVSVLSCGAANASIDLYTASLFGSNEVLPTVGDADGWGSAVLSIDNVANTVSWAIMAMNIGPAVAAHIHAGAAGTNGGVKVDFSAAFSGSNLFDADLATITPGTAANFYVNVHTAANTAGAIRGQLVYVTTVNPPVPEPETYALMLAGLGAVGLIARRRRST